MSQIPNVALADAAMVSTRSVIDEQIGLQTRAQSRQQIEGFLDRGDLQKALSQRGLSTDEIRTRLASLSDREMQQLATEMNQARAGGDLLIAVLVIFIIIFLIRRL